MAYTYSLSTPVGQVRMLIPDSNLADVVNNPPIFTDEEIGGLLALEGSRVKRAAAQALEVIASSEAYTQKVIRLLDLSTDGAKVSDALLKRAALLRKQSADDLAAEELLAETDLSGFEIAEWDLNFDSIDLRRYYRGV